MKKNTTNNVVGSVFDNQPLIDSLTPPQAQDMSKFFGNGGCFPSMSHQPSPYFSLPPVQQPQGSITINLGTTYRFNVREDELFSSETIAKYVDFNNKANPGVIADVSAYIMSSLARGNVSANLKVETGTTIEINIVPAEDKEENKS